MSEYKPKVGDRVRITYDATVKARTPFESLLTEVQRRSALHSAWQLGDITPVSIERAPVEEPPPGSAIRATVDGVRVALLRTTAPGGHHWTDGANSRSFEWAELEDVEVLHAAPASQE